MPTVGAPEPVEDIFFGKRGELWTFETDEEHPYRGWTFAEDGVRLIYHRLGFGSIDQRAWGDEDEGEISGIATPVIAKRPWLYFIAQFSDPLDADARAALEASVRAWVAKHPAERGERIDDLSAITFGNAGTSAHWNCHLSLANADTVDALEDAASTVAKEHALSLQSFKRISRA